MKTQLLLLFALFVSIGIKAQINAADSTVQAITYWGLNESYTYEILQSKEKKEEGENSEKDPIRSIVQISIIDSTATSYVIEWRYLKHEIPNIDFVPELRDLLNKKKYVYRTNEMGEFEELLNWEEVRDNLLATTKESLKVAHSSKAESERESLISEVITAWEALMTKEYVEQNVVEAVNVFHCFYGVSYKIGEEIESDIEVPIPIDGLPDMTAHVRLWLDEIDVENDIYNICLKQEVDQEEVKKLMLQFIDVLSQRLNKDGSIGKEEFEKMFTEDLQYSNIIYSIIDNSGWPLDIYSENSISIGNVQQEKTLQIRMIEDVDIK